MQRGCYKVGKPIGIGHPVHGSGHQSEHGGAVKEDIEVGEESKEEEEEEKE